MIASDLEGYLNLRESQSPMLRARAEMLFQSFKRYRPVLKSSARLVPKPEMAEQIRELLARLEKASRKTGLIEDFEALGVYTFGRVRNIRTRLFGDALQPRTRLTHYSG